VSSAHTRSAFRCRRRSAVLSTPAPGI